MKASELKIAQIKTVTDKEDLVFINIDDEPFSLYGIYRDGDRYRRVPREVADECNDFLKSYQTVTAGGRVRFVTTSPYISVRVVLTSAVRKDLMTDVTASGVDVYVGTRYHATVKNNSLFNAATGETLNRVVESGPIDAFNAPEDIDTAYEAIVNLGDTNGEVITLNLPIFCGVKSVHIGIQKDAEISHAPGYSLEKPIVFYGSSITHGACASRPGLIYENLLSRELDFNYINLGFGGGAQGEEIIGEYISSLDMSAFVMDYDHNAPTPEHLEKTHERMFLQFREKHPTTPVLFLSRPYGKLKDMIVRRQQIIKRTYENALARGDENVWLVLGSEYFPEDLGGDFSVDNCHPNDIGFMFMAKAIKPALEEMIKRATEGGAE